MKLPLRGAATRGSLWHTLTDTILAAVGAVAGTRRNRHMCAINSFASVFPIAGVLLHIERGTITRLTSTISIAGVLVNLERGIVPRFTSLFLVAGVLVNVNLGGNVRVVQAPAVSGFHGASGVSRRTVAASRRNLDSLGSTAGKCGVTSLIFDINLATEVPKITKTIEVSTGAARSFFVARSVANLDFGTSLARLICKAGSILYDDAPAGLYRICLGETAAVTASIGVARAPANLHDWALITASRTIT